jgi:hypothetical protein
MRGRTYALGIAAVFAALSIGCNNISQTVTGPNIDLSQHGSTSEDPPSTNPSPGQVGFDEIRVGIFGHTAGCANAPTNGQNTVRLGCTANATATPKLNGVEVSSTVHGPSCIWYLDGQRVDGLASSNVVALSVDSGNPFNIQLRGLTKGSFTLEAEVKGFRSGAKRFAVE